MKSAIFPGWWQVLIAMLAQAVSAGSIFTAYSVVAAPLQATFEPSNMVLMLGITVTTLVAGLISPPLGGAIDRFSIRNLMLAGSGLMATGFLLLSVSTSMIQVLAIYAVCMSAASILLGPIATSALLARWFTHNRGLAMGIAASGSAIGGLLFPPLLQALIDGLEWRMALRVFGVIVLAITIPLIIGILKERPAPTSTASARRDSDQQAPKTQSLPPLPTKEILGDINFWLIALTLGVLFCGPLAVISNLIQLVGERGIAASKGALLLSIISGANLAGKLVVAAAADRLGYRAALVITLLGLGLGVMGLYASQGFFWLATCCALIGLFAGGASPLWSVTLARVYGPERIGRMMGIMSLVIMPFTLVSAPLFGWVHDTTGSYNMALWGYAGALLLALLMVSQTRIGGTSHAQAVPASETEGTSQA